MIFAKHNKRSVFYHYYGTAYIVNGVNDGISSIIYQIITLYYIITFCYIVCWGLSWCRTDWNGLETVRACVREIKKNCQESWDLALRNCDNKHLTGHILHHHWQNKLLSLAVVSLAYHLYRQRRIQYTIYYLWDTQHSPAISAVCL